MLKRTISVFAFLVLVNICYAQGNCSDLLQQGIRSYFNNSSQLEDFRSAKALITDAYSQYTRDRSEASASFKYSSVFKGKAKYSRDEIEKIGKIFSKETLDAKDVTEIVSAQSSFVDNNFRLMYRDCINALNRKVEFKIVSVDDLLSKMSIEAKFTSDDEQSRPTIGKIYYDSTKIKITGMLKDVGDVNGKLNQIMMLNVERLDLKDTTPIYSAGNKLIAEKGILTIPFSSSSLTVIFPELPYKPKIELTKGVGEIVSSMLSEAVFLKLYGNDWRLANGDATPDGTAYYQVSKTLPDLRGVFLRGKNHDRKLSGNPDGDTPVGTLQYDMLKNHTHTIPFSTKPGNLERAFTRLNQEAEPGVAESGLSPTGGTETRPINVTINYFIKIN